MQKTLVILGLVLIFIGLFLPWLTKLGLGRLPGDLIVKRGQFSLYVPIMTCIILSVVITVLLWFLRKF
ncbi:MAG: DUF2905 domain-containing protein [Gammaproteobacteria bacterium]|nr:DUF2905 domain-containing protein [Gammaproteobacteria bacterium]